MGKRTGGDKTGARALEIAEQINLAKEMIISFHRPGEISEALASWESSGRFTPIIEQVAANPELQWKP